MSRNEVIIAGFGGQGVLLMGKLLAHAAMDEGREVSWLPSYGPEMRGGTANCTVVVSDKPIASPVVDHPGAIVVMNRPSLEKFQGCVAPGGYILMNRSMIEIDPSRADVVPVPVDASEIAVELGNPKAANMVVLGAYLAVTGVVPLERMCEAVAHQFEDKPKAIESNVKALEAGFARARRILEARPS